MGTDGTCTTRITRYHWFCYWLVVAVTKIRVKTPSSRKSSSWGLHEACSSFRKTGRAGRAVSEQVLWWSIMTDKTQRAKHNHLSWRAPARSARQEDCQWAAHRARCAHQWPSEAEQSNGWCFTPSALTGLSEERRLGLSKVHKQSRVWEKAATVPVEFCVSEHVISVLCSRQDSLTSKQE